MKGLAAEAVDGAAAMYEVAGGPVQNTRSQACLLPSSDAAVVLLVELPAAGRSSVGDR